MRLTLLAAAVLAVSEATAQSPAPITREFRGIWVATVGNIDWPSKPGISTWEAQRELLAILDRAVELKLNAIVFQVRPSADAMYPSQYEPWSQFLTGRQGRAPEPPWDPLAFVVEEAHKRGLELHAWFNPYRAEAKPDTLKARSHISRTDPLLVRGYDRYLWMNPGDPEVRRRSIRVITDVTRRYDIDGVHIDDYFYPYPATDRSGKKIDFPDERTYADYVKRGGKLAKDDWRRDNVDKFVEQLYKSVHDVKPWVRVGISPFGIWRPGNPPSVTGFDAYAEIYADSKKWLQNGWADYFAPQLYWPISQPQQRYQVLYDWWLSQNTKKRHIWPGLATYRISDTTATRHILAQEILDEIDSTRVRSGDQGHIHFSMTVLMKNPDGLAEKLATRYADPALVPATPWLGAVPPGKPSISLGLDTETREYSLKLNPTSGEKVWLWTVRSGMDDGGWKVEVLPGWLRVHRLPYPGGVERIVVTAVSRTGMESNPAALPEPLGPGRKAPPPAKPRP
jgi:uncharacterized lipoprotein YddW (UPF0748 family)